MQKTRLTALDGLRGLAALSVAISHSGFSIQTLTSIPIFIGAFRSLASGPNSVQILFVLSGFLMAFLYPTIKHIPEYIQKRYARIFPIFAVIVIFLWQKHLFPYWYQQLFFLMALAVFTHILWKIINIITSKWPLSKYILYGFLLTQLTLVAINLFITPRLLANPEFKLWEDQHNWLTVISNITLTTPFARDIKRYSTVFWSLAPEVYFYLLYPFFVIPLVKLGKKYGAIAGAAISALVIMMLFNLDDTMRGLFAMNTVNIARSSGFVIGVVIGTVYQLRGKTWKRFEPIFKNNFVNIFILAAFIAVQWGDWAVRDGQTIWFMNYYYLLSSLIFGFTVIAAIIPNTIVNKIFSNKVLVFLGLISYSLYLSHIEVHSWVTIIANYVQPFISSKPLFTIIHFAIMIGLNVAVSTFLFKVVEALYFEGKRKTPSVAVAKAELEEQTDIPSDKSKKTPLWEKSRNILVVGLFVIILMWSYTGGIALSLFASHHSFHQASIPQHAKVSLLKYKKVQIPFIAQHDNLSVVTVSMWYYKSAAETLKDKKKPATLVFRLYEEGNKKPFFESVREATLIESEPNFPFGFPTIAQSTNKKYIAELELKNGSREDDIIINTQKGRLVTTYTNSKQEIITKPYKLIWNRIAFTFFHPDTLIVLGLAFVTMIVVKMKAKNA